MTIFPLTEGYEISIREEVTAEVTMIIDGAASSERAIDPCTLAREILDFIEPMINSVDPDGNVIYRI